MMHRYRSIHGALIIAFLAVVPWAAQASTDCHGRRFADTTQRFIDKVPPRPYFWGVPEGTPLPIHLISTQGGSFGCGTAWTVDLDTGHAWLRARCGDEQSLLQFVGSRHWAGARFNPYTDFNGKPAREAVKEGVVRPAILQQLVCMANEAWAAGKFGGEARFDDHGALRDDTPPGPVTDAVSSLLLKDGETTRTLGYFYYPDEHHADGKLQRALEEAVNAAVERKSEP